MYSSLVPTYENRPTWIESEGWHVCISVHDAYFISYRKQLRKKILYAKNRLELTNAIGNYRDWLLDEIYYYKFYNLELPIKCHVHERKNSWVRIIKRNNGSKRTTLATS